MNLNELSRVYYKNDRAQYSDHKSSPLCRCRPQIALLSEGHVTRLLLKPELCMILSYPDPQTPRSLRRTPSSVAPRTAGTSCRRRRPSDERMLQRVPKVSRAPKQPPRQEGQPEQLRQARLRAPYVSIIHSSVFGESRVLYNPAERTPDRDKQYERATLIDMQVVYVCARDIKFSSGFPAAPPKLKDRLLDNNVVTSNCLSESLGSRPGRAWAVSLAPTRPSRQEGPRPRWRRQR